MTTDAEVEGWLARLAAEHATDFGPAMKSLVDAGDRARPALRALVAEDLTDMATRRAFEVLGRISHADDVALLADRLGRARGTLADDAAHGLALHKADAARQALLAATGATDSDIACAAVSALGERGDAAVRPMLQKLLSHGDEEVRHRAKLALEELPR